MHINALNTFFIEEITILHINIKTPLKFKSDDSRTKEHTFQVILEKSISFICPENWNTQNLRSTKDPFISENFRRTEKFKFAKPKLSQRYLINKVFFLNYFLHFGNEKAIKMFYELFYGENLWCCRAWFMKNCFENVYIFISYSFHCQVKLKSNFLHSLKMMLIR